MKNFGEQFKKELDDIRVDPELINRTLERVGNETERPEMPVATKRNGIRRVDFLRTAAAIAAAALVTAGVLFILSRTLESSKEDNSFINNHLDSPEHAEEQATPVMDCIIEPTYDANTQSQPEPSQRSALRRAGSYEQILQQLLPNGLIEGPATTNGNDPPELGKSSGFATFTDEKGVDQADTVNTDENCLYYLSEGIFRIIDIRDARDMDVISEIWTTDDPGSSGIEFFFDSESQKVWLIQSVSNYIGDESSVIGDPSGFLTAYVIVDIYDVSNPSAPVLLRTFSQEGWYVSSRRVGETVYLTTCKETGHYEHGDYNVFPATSEDRSEWIRVPADDIFILGDGPIESFTVISAIRTGSAGDLTTTYATTTRSETMYSSDDMIFIAGAGDIDATTAITSFSIAGGDFRATGSVVIPGNIIRSRAMDLRNDFLRVAVTEDTADGSGTSVSICVLDPDLNIQSSLRGIAPGNRIAAIDFIGDRVCLITSGDAGSLIVVDASDPDHLAIQGELKLPGYINHLYPIGDYFLLGIGRGTEDNRQIAADKLKLSVFDVSDPYRPTEKSTLLFGGQYGYSEAEYNTKALTVHPSRWEYGLPVCFLEAGGDGRSEKPFAGFLTIRVDDNGQLTQELLLNEGSPEYNCRGVYANGRLFVLCATGIYSFDSETFALQGTLRLEAGGRIIID